MQQDKLTEANALLLRIANLTRAIELMKNEKYHWRILVYDKDIGGVADYFSDEICGAIRESIQCRVEELEELLAICMEKFKAL